MIGRTTIAMATPRFDGVGLHTGFQGWIQFLPSDAPGAGILFRDVITGGVVAAKVTSVVSTNRSTSLSSGNTRVDTVEHVLSALYGSGISDVIVDFCGVELPIGDGSALPFVELIEAAGRRTIEGSLSELIIHQEIVVSDGKGSVITVVPSDNFWMMTTVDYSDFSGIGLQSGKFAGSDYKNSLSYARTYGFYSELDALRTAGLGRGVSFDNVIALDQNGEADPRTPLRSKDELVRHKMLDLIGDLSLTQRRLRFGIVAFKPSHQLNVRLAGILLGVQGS